ncbi:Hypothetical predicted protein [Octopus vulgaris]|uniref:Uncharacterized protein n=1 Tax=Octopus vulgaris TaxID=6645 RepID=A0AA36ASB7_OCTVU|nr:Hypothetical predicted protein [Octopus vulgaris]
MSEPGMEIEPLGIVSQHSKVLNFGLKHSETDRANREIKYNLTPQRPRIRSRSVSQSSTDSYSSTTSLPYNEPLSSNLPMLLPFFDHSLNRCEMELIEARR